MNKVWILLAVIGVSMDFLKGMRFCELFYAFLITRSTITMTKLSVVVYKKINIIDRHLHASLKLGITDYQNHINFSMFAYILFLFHSNGCQFSLIKLVLHGHW